MGLWDVDEKKIEYEKKLFLKCGSDDVENGKKIVWLIFDILLGDWGTVKLG